MCSPKPRLIAYGTIQTILLFLIELNAFVCLGWQLTIAVYVTVHVYFFVTYFLVLFEALHPSQQFLAMSECFPGLKMKCLAQGHATVTLMRF